MKKYSLILLLMGAAGCDLVVDVDMPIEQQKLTLNSFFIQDSVWSAKLTLNRHVLDEGEFKIVDDGFVVVYDQGIPLDTLISKGNGIYRGGSSPSPGESYEIRATSASHGSVRGQSYIPNAVAIDTLEIEILPSSTAYETRISIRLQLEDPGNEVNYFQVLFAVEQTYTDQITGEETIFRQPVPLESNDPAALSADTYNREGVFFKDISFNGKRVSLPLESRLWNFGTEEVKLIFYLRTLSEDFYKYKITSSLQNETSGDPFAQPVSVYTNIENGFGIFAGFSQSIFVYQY